MTYFVISPKILECSAPSGGQVDCAVTYDMEEYGLHKSLEYCQFSLVRPANGQDAPSIRVKDAALGTPLYDAFWRGFCLYVLETLGIDVFSEAPKGQPARKFYLSDVQFDPTKKVFTSSSIQVCRH